MKKINVLSFTVALLFSSCNAQVKEKGKETFGGTAVNVPKKDIRVNKEFDKNGNLIKYDSTYSFYYSNTKNNSILADSIYNNFRNHFHTEYPFSEKPFFENFFFHDSLIEYDYYKKDFFSEKFTKDFHNMDKLFQDIDALKNIFFEEQLSPTKSPPSKTKGITNN